MNGATGAVFQPELIEVMKTVLDEVTATLTEAKRTSAIKADIASRILKCAASGPRSNRIEECRSRGSCGMLALFSRYLAGTTRSLSPSGLAKSVTFGQW
jgi:hypothetical protein